MSPSRPFTRRGRPAWLRAVLRGSRGASLIEFALVAGPLLFLLFGTIELGLIFVVNMNLSNSVFSLARQVRLGSVVLPGTATTTSSGKLMSLSDFKSNVCANIGFLSPAGCRNALQVDVRVMSSFAGAPPNPVSGTTFSTGAFCFYSGSPGNVVSIRTYLLWPVTTPILLSPLAQVKTVSAAGGTSSGNYFVLMANEAFVSEPNGTVSNTGAGC